MRNNLRYIFPKLSLVSLIQKHFNIFCFIILIAYTQGASSQTTCTFNLFFESNTYTLSVENIAKIDSVISRLNNIPAAYEVEIEGHSDTTGQLWLNKSISRQRARETLIYLESKGFSRKSINTSAKGSAEPIDVNHTEAGKAHNRRVTVIIRLNLPDISNLGGFSLIDEKFTLSADSGGIFFDTSGTVITIPPDAFIDENGQPVTGHIDFSYLEYRDPVDLLLSGISMHEGSGNNREYFNSYGMFKLKAYHNGKLVFLKKDKSAEIDFAMDREPKNADIFEYDSLSKKWKKPLRGDEGSRYYGPICGGSRGGGGGFYDHCLCRMGNCEALEFLIKTTKNYVEGKESLYADFMKKDPLHIFETLDSLYFYNRLCPQIEYRIDSIEKRIKMDTHTYTVVNLKRGLLKLKFSIKCQSRKKSEFVPLKTIKWKCSVAKNKAVLSKLDKQKWAYCLVSKSDTGFTIQLSNQNDQIELKEVRGLPKERMFKTKKRAFLEKQYSEYETLRLPYHTRMKELDELKDLLNKQLESCRPMQDSLKKIMALHSWYYCQLQKDPMFCFWNSNRYFMPLAEKELLFTKWLRYFDEHKDEMEARVVKVRQSTEYISCLQRSQNGKYDLGQLPDKPVRSVASQTLGTYNIAEVVKLLDTVIVYASYTDMDGNNLEPVIIYLTDKTVNTVIRYDGTDKYSPYKFRLSPTTVKAMIAIDKQGSAYLCSPEHLRGIHVNGHQLTHTFILKKIQKIKGKQELLKLLEHDGSYPELTVQPAPKEK